MRPTLRRSSTRRVQKKKRCSTHKKQKRNGGVWPFSGSSNSTVVVDPNPTATCDVCTNVNWLDELYTSRINSVWKTCIHMNNRYNQILYVTQKNVWIKSVETLQIPIFQVQLEPSLENIPCKMMIEDKYINCFLYICGNWYAMMRLFGKTINTGYFARTERNKAYYQLHNAVHIDILSSNNMGTIQIRPNTYTEVNKTTMLDTNKTKIILFHSEVVENIDKKKLVDGENVFTILQRFRLQKLFANNEKQHIIVDEANDMFEFLDGIP